MTKAESAEADCEACEERRICSDSQIIESANPSPNYRDGGQIEKRATRAGSPFI